MPRFIYRAKKGPEEALEGVIEADSETTALNKLIRSGYYPVWITEGAARKNLDRVRVKTKDLADFTRRLSGLLGSGLELYNSLSVVENQAEDNNLKLIAGVVKNRVKEGMSFSGALKKYPNVFSGLYISLIYSGEESGMMDKALADISDFLDKEEDIRSKVIAALVYPGLMAITGFATIFILITFIVPKLVNMFIEMGEDLPLATRILLGVSGFMGAYWILFALFAGGVIFLFKGAELKPAVKMRIDRIKLKIPVFGDLVKNAEFARFSKTFSMLLKSGIPALYSLKIAGDVITNDAIKEDVRAVHNDVKAGLSITGAMKKRKTFPVFLINMAVAGEKGGFLDKALLNAAAHYEIEIDRAIKIITTLLEPVFILIMGLVVGFIVVSMLLPVFQISLSAQ